ncbi:ACP S-malonyltransferase [Parasporobacterium paucivorans]|uniref:Malonyl CoA-acyl carrier protein transacylase n=1 Tax=Parasporobacterium paucivorans DSM 15970 TaxID=1122934 RepID=A0A1M6KBT6_9FIRM|nr:ACP S-malonyltransferase [Parasporobacterium paucivorans]SHJ56428.1 [acyl-carrier-protein] S-malonyltransferase [Parasporobacterium paucivorans DSM 15970]
MGKIAFVFPGQGAQYVGMGKKLVDISPASARVFSQADAVRSGTSAQCFAGSDEELAMTANTQPCMFTVELAAAAALMEAGINPDVLAGFSLGEVAALTASEAVDFETGFRLVIRRGELMADAAGRVDSAMAAVVKLTNEKVNELCSGYEHVYPVNYNCPGQVTVAGLKTELDQFKEDVKAAGGRAIPLKVAGGFHSPFMEEAAEEFGKVLEQEEIHPAKITLYSNYTARPYEGDYRKLLKAQICNPVRWQQIIQDMIDEGVDMFIEVGPGKVLSGFIGKISGDVRVLHVEDAESLQETIKEVKSYVEG